MIRRADLEREGRLDLFADTEDPPQFRPTPLLLSSGYPKIDDLLGGGVPTGSAVAIVGLEETLKSHFALSFLAAAPADFEILLLDVDGHLSPEMARCPALRRAHWMPTPTWEAIDIAIDALVSIDARAVIVIDSLASFDVGGEWTPECRAMIGAHLDRWARQIAESGSLLVLVDQARYAPWIGAETAATLWACPTVIPSLTLTCHTPPLSLESGALTLVRAISRSGPRAGIWDLSVGFRPLRP